MTHSQARPVRFLGVLAHAPSPHTGFWGVGCVPSPLRGTPHQHCLLEIWDPEPKHRFQ